LDVKLLSIIDRGKPVCSMVLSGYFLVVDMSYSPYKV